MRSLLGILVASASLTLIAAPVAADDPMLHPQHHARHHVAHRFVRSAFPAVFPLGFGAAFETIAPAPPPPPAIVVLDGLRPPPAPRRSAADERPTVEMTPSGVEIVRGPGTRHTGW